MPERPKVVSVLTEKTLGGPFVWDGRTGEIQPGQGVTTEDWDERARLIDGLFVEAAGAIDWDRVLLGAAGRHLTRHPDEPSPWGSDGEPGVCGECLAWSLLTT